MISIVVVALMCLINIWAVGYPRPLPPLLLPPLERTPPLDCIERPLERTPPLERFVLRGVDNRVLRRVLGVLLTFRVVVFLLTFLVFDGVLLTFRVFGVLRTFLVFGVVLTFREFWFCLTALLRPVFVLARTLLRFTLLELSDRL